MQTAPLAYVNSNQAPVQQVIIQNSPVPTYPYVGYRPRKEKSTAGILALMLGGLGGQHFYLGNTVAGILSIVFCWTYIPAIIGLIQGVMLLCMNEHDFHVRYG
jgi:TM2 domain-containing membrane protein YozV